MKHFILITNACKDQDMKLSRQIMDYIEKKGGTARCFLSNTGALEVPDFAIEEIPPNTECIMVLGGDGTLIRVATKVESLQIPLIGVNLGTLGYLCELEEGKVFAAIDRLMEEVQDAYMLEKRIMLTGHKAGCRNARIALNDIVIHRSGALGVLSLKVHVNGEFLSTYHADGIIIATPTGSTGYNMSAGGPIVDPKGTMLVLTPNNAHNLNSKSIVLDAEDSIEIEIGSRGLQRVEEAYVSFDGDMDQKLIAGERFVISKAKNYTTICKLNKRSFLEILRKKMETYT